MRARARCVVARAAAAPAADRGSGVEAAAGARDAAREAARAALRDGATLDGTDLGVGERYVGKVRDLYVTADAAVAVTTDRQSAFDRVLAAVPFKGRVLTAAAEWWFRNTADIVPNAFVCCPHPNVTVMRKAEVFPVEFVVRGYITGSTSTSLWTVYNAGARTYCGNALADGWVKNQKLPQNMLTPTTKAEDHDEPISPAEIVERGLMSQEDWDEVSAYALALFERGQAVAERNGVLLVDTKYEFGKDAAGNIVLIDEVHTPDSSRWWKADTYAERHAAGLEPENIDKEFLRLWFAANCDPYNDAVLPEAPADLVAELSARYVLLYELITGSEFDVAGAAGASAGDQNPAMRAATLAALEEHGFAAQ